MSLSSVPSSQSFNPDLNISGERISSSYWFILPETLILLISPDLSENIGLGSVTDLEAGHEAEQLMRGRHLETLLTEEIVDIGAISEQEVETWTKSWHHDIMSSHCVKCHAPDG